MLKVWIWYGCHYHHGGEELGFCKKVHIETHRLSKKKDVLVVFVLEESKNSNLLIYWQKPYSKQRQMSYSTWRKLTKMNRNWAGKLQVILLFGYITRKKLCSQTFKASSEEVIVMRSEKMKEKYMKEDVWKSSFHKLAGCHLAITLRTNLFIDSFQWF